MSQGKYGLKWDGKPLAACFSKYGEVMGGDSWAASELNRIDDILTEAHLSLDKSRQLAASWESAAKGYMKAFDLRTDELQKMTERAERAEKRAEEAERAEKELGKLSFKAPEMQSKDDDHTTNPLPSDIELAENIVKSGVNQVEQISVAIMNARENATKEMEKYSGIKNTACGDALDKLWKDVILKRIPAYGDWEYPGFAYRHLLFEYEDLSKSQKNLLDSLEELLGGIDSWDDAVSKIVDTTKMPKWAGKEKARELIAQTRKKS